MLQFKKKLLCPAFPPGSLLYALRCYSHSCAGWNNWWNRPVWSRNLKGRTEKYMDTPFSKPSDMWILGKIKNVDCIFLARHGRQHIILPSKVNYQVNMWALKEEGCTQVLVIRAWGSLREHISPVIPSKSISSSIAWHLESIMITPITTTHHIFFHR